MDVLISCIMKTHLFCTAIFLFFVPYIVYAYEVDTHAYLTNEAIKYFDVYNASKKIDSKFISFFIDGARREDDAPRWMNHFYDPIYGRGLSTPVLGVWYASKDWAVNEDAQNDIKYKVPATIASILSAIQLGKISEITTETNYSWNQALRYYILGEKEKAFFMLGHVVHLVQDASVPDHTRNDEHPDGSVYEKYAEQFTLQSPDNSLSSRLANRDFILKDSLDSYFREIAEYSNKNFYSEESIGIQSGYNSPQPVEEELIDGYYFGIFDDGHGKYVLYKKNSKGTLFSSVFSITTNNDFVKKSYWNRLSVKSVEYSAGVVDLFFREAERLKNDKDFLSQDDSFFGYIQGLFASAGSAFSNMFQSVFGSNKNEFENVGTENPIVEEDDEEIPFEDNPQDDISSTTMSTSSIEEDASSSLPVVFEDLQEISTSSPTSSLEKIIASTTEKKKIIYPFVLNEVMYDADGSDTDREWIEIRHTGGDGKSIMGCSIREGGTNHKIHEYQGSTLIEYGDYVVLADNPEKFMLEYPSVTRVLKTTLSLSNTEEKIELVCDDEIVDSLTYAKSIGGAGDGETIQKFSLSLLEASYPTPGRMNIRKSVGGSSIATSQNTTETTLATSSVVATSTGTDAKSVVISEILFNADGTDTGKEFIELYNPYPNPIHIDGWKLRMRIGEGEEQSLAEINESDGDPGYIPAQGFYLVGFSKYNADFFQGVSADTIRSKSLPNGTATTTIVLYNDLGVFDEMSYSSSSAHMGESLERKSFLNLLCTTQTYSHEAEYYGNGCDTGHDSDFYARINPLPQNSHSLPEPRIRFFAPANIQGKDFVTFERGLLSLQFTWAQVPSPDSRIPKYRISGSSSLSKIEDVITASTTASVRIEELGTTYNFSLVAEDEEGFQSQPTDFSISVPSLFDAVHVYSDLATGTDRYLFDAHFSEFPFIPSIFGRNAFQGVMVYINTDPDVSLSKINTSNRFRGDTNSGQVEFVYSRCVGGFWGVREGSIVFALNSQICGAGGGLNNSAMPFWDPEDNRFVVQFADAPSQISFSDSDYFTLAFYDMSDSGGGSQELSLVAYDRTKHYFSSHPTHFSSPIVHDGFSVSFSASDSEVSLDMPSITDSDSYDGDLILESNYSPGDSSLLDDAKWTSIEKTRRVFPGDSFLIGIRAKDREGNVSNVATTTWTFPASPDPFTQNLMNSWSPGFGSVVSNSNNPDTAVLQSVISSSSLVFDSIKFRVIFDSGDSYGAVRIAVFEGNESGPDISKFLGSAVTPVVCAKNEEQELLLNFGNTLTCSANTHCWFVADMVFENPQGYFWTVWKVRTAGSDVHAGISGTGLGSGVHTPPEYVQFTGTTNDDWYMTLYHTPSS